MTKLLRNLFMLAVIPLMAVLYRSLDEPGRGRVSLAAAVPRFVVGFVAMTGLRTLSDLGDEPLGGLVTAGTWAGAIDDVAAISTWCLAVAMAAVGLGTDVGRLRA